MAAVGPTRQTRVSMSSIQGGTAATAGTVLGELISLLFNPPPSSFYLILIPTTTVIIMDKKLTILRTPQLLLLHIIKRPTSPKTFSLIVQLAMAHSVLYGE